MMGETGIWTCLGCGQDTLDVLLHALHSLCLGQEEEEEHIYLHLPFLALVPSVIRTRLWRPSRNYWRL